MYLIMKLPFVIHMEIILSDQNENISTEGQKRNCAANLVAILEILPN